jgi:exopolysaccharide production protein ExoZ
MREPAPVPPSTIVTIQYLRGIAASLVVLHHAMSPTSLLPIFPTLRIGEFGVDLFFVISGYIMWTTTENRPTRPLRFWGARILRVVPLYWIFTTLYVLLVRPGLFSGVSLDPLYIVQSYLFVPVMDPVYNEVKPVYTLGWTLHYEMFFYFVFGCCLVIPQRMARLAAAVGAILLLVVTGFVARPDSAVAATYTDPILLEFAAGILLAHFAPRLHARPPAVGWALIGAAAVWLAFHAVIDEPKSHLGTFGFPAIAMVAGALMLEPFARARPNRFALLLGGASYSIYLAHPFAQRVWYFTFDPVGGSGSIALLVLYVVTSVIVGICAGLGSYLLIERPIIGAARRLITRRPDVRAAAT